MTTSVFRTIVEYGEGSAVSTLGDIYSLGILLLEMFTGRSPTDDMFRDALDLHKFAKDALPDRTLEIADSTIWLHGETQDNTAASRIQECLVSVFKLGISSYLLVKLYVNMERKRSHTLYSRHSEQQ